MKTIKLKVLRDLVKMKLHTLAIILTLACGIGVYSGVDMALKSLFYTRDRIFKEMNFADLEIQFLPEDVRNLPDFSDIPGLKKVERRLVMPGIININKDKRLTALMVFMDERRPEINKIKIIKGREINPDVIDEALIERTLYDYYNFMPGDAVSVKVGEKIYINKIAGIGTSPEYVVVSANPENFLPEKGSLGVIFTSLKQIDKNLGFTMVNDLLFSYKEGADPKLVQIAILEKLKEINLERVIPYKEHFTYKYLDIDLHAFDIYVPAIVIVLGSLSFIITLININRLLNEQRKEIGAIMALGYSSFDITKAYAFGAVVICALGLFVGFPLSLLLRNIFIYIYSNALGLISVYYEIYIWSLAKGFIFAIITIGISFYIPLYKLLKFSPREIIHPSMKNQITDSYLIRSLFNKTAGLPITVRIGIRNIFRERKRTLSTVFSIALACAVAISYMISITSTIKTVEDRFRKGKWHIVVDFLYPVFYEDYEEFKGISGVKQVEPFFRHYGEIGNNENFEGSGMLGIYIDSVMRELPLIKGHQLKSKNEIILSHDLVKKLKLKIGDKVKVKIGMKIYDFRLAGIKSDVVIGESFIDFIRSREIFEFNDEASGVFIKTDQNLQMQIESEIYKRKFVGKVTYKKKLVEKFLYMISEITRIVDVATAISIFVALLFIFTSISMSISEKEGEYATLRAIGYKKNLIRSIVYSESMIVGLAASILTVPFAVGIGIYLNSLMSEAWFNVDTYFIVKDFAWGIIPMLLLIPLSILPALKYLIKMNITEALRTKIIE
ncbi:MAG: ABC transporter permease [Candidatus Firestonebacteria bacterium]|nr:ABC transporter permease [Candidatus Firestonebacteria bacterium]